MAPLFQKWTEKSDNSAKLITVFGKWRYEREWRVAIGSLVLSFHVHIRIKEIRWKIWPWILINRTPSQTSSFITYWRSIWVSPKIMSVVLLENKINIKVISSILNINKSFFWYFLMHLSMHLHQNYFLESVVHFVFRLGFQFVHSNVFFA